VGFPIFAITDGDTRIDLLEFLTLADFKSSIIEPQGGTWGVTPFADGRVPIDMTLGNLMIEATLSAEGCNQDDVAYKGQKVRQLLENARQYWLSPSWKTPVWVEMQGSTESHMRYAFIYDYRAPGSGNPFASPLFDAFKSMLIFPLVLETTPWQSQPLGAADCIETDNLQSFNGTSISIHVHIANPNDDDDDYENRKDNTHSSGGAYAGFGARSVGYYTNGWTIWRNVPIPKGAIITSAYISFKANNNYNSTTVNVTIRGESSTNPLTFNANVNDMNVFEPPKRNPDVAAHVDWDDVSVWVNDTWYDTPDISIIIQEIIDLADWDSGDGICLHVDNNVSSTNANRYYHAAPFTGITGDEPILYVSYVPDGSLAGRAATCTKEVMISNKHNQAQITHIVSYDHTAGTYTDLIALGWPQPLFRSATAIGDILYLGVDRTSSGFGPFRSLIFDLLGGSFGLDLEYSYTTPMGGGFTPFTNGLTDNTNFLTNTGVCGIHFEQPLDFDHDDDVDCPLGTPVDAYWFKIEVTDNNGGTFEVPVQQNRNIYTVVTPYFDIEADQLKGDLPLLARTKLFNRGYGVFSPIVPYNNGNMNLAYAEKIILATRRLSRGADFTPYLNISDWQQPTGVSCDVIPGAVGISLVEDTLVAAMPISGSPTGKMGFYHHVGTTSLPLAEVLSCSLNSSVARQYAGRYAAYIRCATYGPGSTNFQFALKIRYGINPHFTDYQTKTVYIGTDPLCTYIDTFSLMEDLMENDYQSNLEIRIMIGSPDTAVYPHLFIYDLVLVPVDEFVCVADSSMDLLAYSYPGSLGGGTGVFADIDSIMNPKSMRVYAREESNDNIIGPLTRLSRNPWMLNPRTAQRVWYFSPGSLNISYAVQQFGVSRYWDLRGND
jgi:hypothetical protein